MKYWKAACVFFWALVLSLAADAQLGIGGPILGSTPVNWASPGAIGSGTPNTGAFTTLSGTTITATTKFLAADGLVGTPSFAFANETNTGFYRVGASNIGFTLGGTRLLVLGSGIFGIDGTASAFTLYTAGFGAIGAQISLDAANAIAQKNGTNAQTNKLYFSTTGPVHWMATARTAGVLYTATGGAAQVSYAQTTVPTVTTNGGTSPVCVGTDTAMVCTIGTTPPAAATFTVTFNGTWPAAPSCVAMRNTTGASPLVQGVVPGTTTVVVNLSANLVAGEKFAIQCFGVS